MSSLDALWDSKAEKIMITLTKMLGRDGRTAAGQPIKRASVRDKLLIKEVPNSLMNTKILSSKIYLEAS